MGATTESEFHAFIEQDKALERRFARIDVAPPSSELTVEILRSARIRYEAHHRLVVTDEAIQAAVDLTARFVTDRYFPDKAFEAIDRAAALARTQQRGDGDLAVAPAQVAMVVSEMARLPVGQLTLDESERMQRIGPALKSRVVGQDAAVERVAEAVRSARHGLKVNAHRPNGCFIFGGPPGVGKTELAKALAGFLFHSDDALVRIDMSEMAREGGKARLLGSAPGYRDSGRGGQLTEAVKRRPASVVLFDEIEKGDPEVLDLLLQVCGEGRLTDGMGETVDFSNTLVIMTTNLGARSGDARAVIERELRAELIDRMDAVIVFAPLSASDARRIVEIKVEGVRRQLAREHRIDAVLTDTAELRLVELAFGADQGARDLERAITRLVVAPIARLLTDVGHEPGSTLVVDASPDSTEFSITVSDGAGPASRRYSG